MRLQIVINLNGALIRARDPVFGAPLDADEVIQMA